MFAYRLLVCIFYNRRQKLFIDIAYIFYNRRYNMTSHKYLVTVSKEESSWLDSHPEVSKSGLFQRVVSFLMKKEGAFLSQDDLELIAGDVMQ
jgi:hypothetical protein